MAGPLQTGLSAHAGCPSRPPDPCGISGICWLMMIVLIVVIDVTIIIFTVIIIIVNIVPVFI